MDGSANVTQNRTFALSMMKSHRLRAPRCSIACFTKERAVDLLERHIYALGSRRSRRACTLRAWMCILHGGMSLPATSPNATHL